MEHRRIDPQEVPVPDRHQLILGTVGPRPIAFASTMSADGVPNLAPYSFFNAFSSNPPILIFSSNRRVRGNTTKDTLHNVEATGEVVINLVSHEIVRQMSLASIEYPPEVDEFRKAGFTPVPSEKVKPFWVKESPVNFECKVRQIIPLGTEGGAGNLIVCEVVLMHMSEHIFDAEGKIDPQQLDLMARLGRAYYCRVRGENIFPIVQPVNRIGIGFDGLPEHIRSSAVLTGNELAELAAMEALPGREEVSALLKKHAEYGHLDEEGRHHTAKELIQTGAIADAFALLMDRDNH